MLWVVLRQRWRWSVIASAPDLHLCLAVLCGRLRLVQSLQRAIVTLIQAPGFVDGDPQHVHLVERNPQRANRALQDGRVGDVELKLLGAHEPAGLARFRAAVLSQVHVGPTGETVVLIPGALTVP